jgi:hypothetical protein
MRPPFWFPVLALGLRGLDSSHLSISSSNHPMPPPIEIAMGNSGFRRALCKDMRLPTIPRSLKS